MFFMFIGTYTKWTFIDFSPVQRVLLLIFLCHTVTHGTDLRRSPPQVNVHIATLISDPYNGQPT